MRKLDKEHLKVILWIVLGIALIIYIPYGLAYTSLWFKPFSYVFIPETSIKIPPNSSGVLYYGATYGQKIPYWNLMLMAWFEGLLKLLFSIVTMLAIGLTCYVGYLLFDWLFPRVDNKYTKDKTE